MNAKPFKVAVEDDEGRYRSLTKIVPYTEGGFAVLAPYHAAKEGFLCKIAVPEELRGRFSLPAPAEIHRYSAADRVKLSFHLDGFIQFSGENPSTIRSGREANPAICVLRWRSANLCQDLLQLTYGLCPSKTRTCLSGFFRVELTLNLHHLRDSSCAALATKTTFACSPSIQDLETSSCNRL